MIIWTFVLRSCLFIFVEYTWLKATLTVAFIINSRAFLIFWPVYHHTWRGNHVSNSFQQEPGTGACLSPLYLTVAVVLKAWLECSISFISFKAWVSVGQQGVGGNCATVGQRWSKMRGGRFVRRQRDMLKEPPGRRKGRWVNMLKLSVLKQRSVIVLLKACDNN